MEQKLRECSICTTWRPRRAVIQISFFVFVLSSQLHLQVCFFIFVFETSHEEYCQKQRECDVFGVVQGAAAE